MFEPPGPFGRQNNLASSNLLVDQSMPRCVQKKRRTRESGSALFTAKDYFVLRRRAATTNPMAPTTPRAMLDGSGITRSLKKIELNETFELTP